VRWVVAVVLAVFLLPAGLAGGQERPCTLIGCSSGIGVALPGPGELPRRAVRVTVCMNDRCTSTRLTRTSGQLVRVEDPRLAGPGPVRVRVVLRDGRGRRVSRAERDVTLLRAAPNGPDCPPACWSAALEFGANGRLSLG
jgi:hypothetical protein